jgi:hypothetical protein
MRMHFGGTSPPFVIRPPDARPGGRFGKHFVKELEVA